LSVKLYQIIENYVLLPIRCAIGGNLIPPIFIRGIIIIAGHFPHFLEWTVFASVVVIIHQA